MKRGEIWTVAGGSDYTGKPRPAVVVQHDEYDSTSSVTICPLTSETHAAPQTRPLLRPDSTNGLREPSRVMVDKIATVRTERIGSRVGHLNEERIAALDRSLLRFLGLPA